VLLAVEQPGPLARFAREEGLYFCGGYIGLHLHPIQPFINTNRYCLNISDYPSDSPALSNLRQGTGTPSLPVIYFRESDLVGTNRCTFSSSGILSPSSNYRSCENLRGLLST
jgi:hypothetical protein